MPHGPFHDWDTHADRLICEGEIDLPYLMQAIGWLAELADPLRILDIGSGPGVATVVLAQRFPAARVTAADGASGLLAAAQQRGEHAGVADRVSTMKVSLDGDLASLPQADLIWASRVIHHVPDQAAVLRRLAGRLHPGGLIALVEGGLPVRFLPEEYGAGAPGLLHRLDAAASLGLAPVLHHDGSSPVPRPVLDWPFQLAQAGLTPSGSRTFLLDLPAPVTAAVRTRVARRLQLTLDLASEHLTSADRDSVERLLDPANQLGVLNRPDLFLLSANTVHTARRPR